MAVVCSSQDCKGLMGGGGGFEIAVTGLCRERRTVAAARIRCTYLTLVAFLGQETGTLALLTSAKQI